MPTKAMRNDSDVYATFAVCETLGGMTVSEMTQRMSSFEFTHWLAYLKEKHRREERAMREARRR